MEAKLKHLEFIQAVIARLSTTSFLVKGWSITLAAGLYTLSENNTNIDGLLLIAFTVFILWTLDGYFLVLERGFRNLYNEVRKEEPERIDFSMHIDKGSWNFIPLLKAMFSFSVFLFHGTIAVSMYFLHLVN